MDWVRLIAILIVIALLIAVVVAAGAVISKSATLAVQGRAAIAAPVWTFTSAWAATRELGLNVLSEGADLSGIGIGVDLWIVLEQIAVGLVTMFGAYWMWRGLKSVLT